MLLRWRQWRRRRILERYRIDDRVWNAVLTDAPLFDRLDRGERERLRELTVLFLAAKRFFGAHGFEVDEYVRTSVASRAALLVLELDLDYYAGWRTVIVYPGGFVAEREVEDELGVVHAGMEALDGESMYGGAVVLNWDEARPDRHRSDADVVIHEFAHKLDERNGEANGMPPLHRDQSAREWARVFTDAFEVFTQEADAGAELPFDDYATTHPAEFFAVATETFFLRPQTLRVAFPEVYRALTVFYRQDPAPDSSRGLSVDPRLGDHG